MHIIIFFYCFRIEKLKTVVFFLEKKSSGGCPGKHNNTFDVLKKCIFHSHPIRQGSRKNSPVYLEIFSHDSQSGSTFNPLNTILYLTVP